MKKFIFLLGKVNVVHRVTIVIWPLVYNRSGLGRFSGVPWSVTLKFPTLQWPIIEISEYCPPHHAMPCLPNNRPSSLQTGKEPGRFILGFGFGDRPFVGPGLLLSLPFLLLECGGVELFLLGGSVIFGQDNPALGHGLTGPGPGPVDLIIAQLASFGLIDTLVD